MNEIKEILSKKNLYEKIFDYIIPIITIFIMILAICILFIGPLIRNIKADENIIKNSNEYIKYKECNRINKIYYCK